MQDIDFLPADFKRRRTNRHGRSWQIIVAGAAAVLLVFIAIGQDRALNQIEKRLEEIEPERKVLDARRDQLEDLRHRLDEAETLARLQAYMEHPWPKTQLLAVTLHSLPDAVTFGRIRISHDSVTGHPLQRRPFESEEEDAARLQPAERDLGLLRQQCDFAVVAIALEGETTDGLELHRYLDRLNHTPLLDKAELQSLEAVDGETDARFRFEARLTVRPGYGQPNGPNGRASHLAQATQPSHSISEESRQP